MTKGGYLIYGTAHMHTGVVNSTLYGQVNFIRFIYSLVIHFVGKFYNFVRDELF